MLARLGQVIYWAACGIAVVVVLFGIAMSFGDNDDSLIIIVGSLVYAALVWLLGRAALYVSAGK